MTEIVGHDAQAAVLGEAVRSGRFHHAWLLAGPQGIGKASFARAMALRLLAEAAGLAVPATGLGLPEEHQTARLVAAGSHPDFTLLARLPHEKTGELVRGISVDQVRGLQRLFATTPTFSPLRIVLVDSADDLGREAANALLKNLEEPPPGTLFLLVSHAPGRLLPTIRSRCRLLRFSPLADEAMRAIVREALPDASPDQVAALVRAGEGAPARALHFAGLDIAALEADMSRVLRDGDRSGAIRAALARALGTKAMQARYEAFLERVPARLAAEARAADGARRLLAVDLWEKARALASSAVPLSLDPQATIFEMCGYLAALAPPGAAAKA